MGATSENSIDKLTFGFLLIGPYLELEATIGVGTVTKTQQQTLVPFYHMFYNARIKAKCKLIYLISRITLTWTSTGTSIDTSALVLRDKYTRQCMSLNLNIFLNFSSSFN